MLVHELQVYKDTYELVKMIHQMSGRFPKLHRYTLGERLCKDAGELFVPIQLANRATTAGERVKYLERFFLYFETVKIRLRLAYDLHCISIKEYALLVELTTKIGKQINGWRRSAKQ